MTTKVYKPYKPIINMTENKKELILKVQGNKNKQKRITIPINSDISEGEYVVVTKLK